MRLRGVKSSRNVEDRRGRSRGKAVGGIGGVGLLLVLAVGYFAGIDVTPLLTQQPASRSQPYTPSPQEEQEAEFAARVLATTEEVWTQVFRDEFDATYTPPVMVLFSDVTQSPCGGASGATGPFYCPADQKAYLDLSFFATLSQQLGASGDFAAAYVIAHEVAHHVQNQVGILGQVDQARRQASQSEANALTVRLELQADCLSGVWAAAVGELMERGDLQEALNAANKIGDDHLQRQAGRVPQPHTFTHGTSAQREKWFRRGYEKRRVAACDTFGTDRL
ncbi:KPN_02809 family neutral zinc metallopeptidase [Sedimentitalea todarodis]|uniref:Neutral zinc metallopeptidase n=1 Tax=Sedimentitalea todarodis TaxID=1631240 RepID=A0ABU3V9P6_9RHOB|nr:neutral zinc metallopeptidase [Sedimentitalea todarodis]MDU9002888.1 neutral zinc metallopeptidase [Sedimentitalea todarodis]